jgi:hypothetical protein
MEYIRRRENEPRMALSTSSTEAVIRRIEKERIIHDKEYVMTISVRAALKQYGYQATEVMTQELRQILDKRVWNPVAHSSLSEKERNAIIRSSMFLKEKFLSCGDFEKLKARLVAGGNQQDRTLYEDLSAPTVSTSSVFAVAAIAAAENRAVMVVDIGGAFLNADMVGIPVHMRLDATMTAMLIQLDPAYARYTDSKGCVVVVLNKALYGCVQSAALWYENIRKSLEEFGFIRNPHDMCVFNVTGGDGKQCTLTLHVDDVLVTCQTQQTLDSVAEHLTRTYKEIRRTDGPVVGYLGMTFDMSRKGEARITMQGYVDDLLAGCGVDGAAKTPATDTLFEVRDESVPATEAEKLDFHRQVAKMLYLAKRVRPECLTTVSFLATRVTKCDSDDLGKLRRLLRYVRATRERGIVLRPGSGGVSVRAYIDAAYGVHVDGKSHTGSAITIGEGSVVHAKSVKQQNVTKSSTEAELVALSDSANQAFHMRNFIVAQGHNVGPVVLYQDNLSCMALVEKGRSSSERTRHISIRYYWVKERVASGEAVVEHLRTEKMFANILTKPLQGAQFQLERQGLTHWE